MQGEFVTGFRYLLLTLFWVGLVAGATLLVTMAVCALTGAG